MGRNKLVPAKDELRKMLDRGMTHGQIAELVYERTGARITPAAVSVARNRYGLKRQIPRYPQALPWRVKVEHNSRYVARMLRAHARRKAGLPLPPEVEKKLDTWINTLKVNNAVVHYNPNTEEGFFYVDPRPGIDTGLVRVPDEPER